MMPNESRAESAAEPPAAPQPGPVPDAAAAAHPVPQGAMGRLLAKGRSTGAALYGRLPGRKGAAR